MEASGVWIRAAARRDPLCLGFGFIPAPPQGAGDLSGETHDQETSTPVHN